MSFTVCHCLEIKKKKVPSLALCHQCSINLLKCPADDLWGCEFFSPSRLKGIEIMHRQQKAESKLYSW